MDAIPKGADLRSIVFRNTLIVLWYFGSWTAVSIIPSACVRGVAGDGHADVVGGFLMLLHAGLGRGVIGVGILLRARSAPSIVYFHDS